jgi:hypothetical protein
MAENARLNNLLDNRDDVLRKTNKEKREYRSLLGEAKEKVVELESLLDDARAQIDSLKSAPIVTNEPKCIDCSTFLVELTVLKEKYASKVEELDVLRVELDEMKSRPSLLGACTSCPILHEKLDVSLVYARSLEAQLKAPIPTVCSTCEINVVKNMELAHYVDCLQDENDELRKLMGWLSGHEHQLRIMIETYKCPDGEALGANKVGEGSGENEEKIRDILEPQKTHHKNAFVPKPNHLRNRLDTTPAPLVFPPQTDNFQKPIKFKSDLGMSSLGRRERNRVRRSQSPKRTQNQSQNQNPSIVRIVGGMGTLLSFASGGSVRRGWLESWPTRIGTALLMVCLSLSWYREARVWCVPFTLERGVSLCLVESHHIEKVVGVLGLGVVSLLDIPSLVDNTSMGGLIAVLGPRGATVHGLPFVVHVVLQGDVWVFHLGEIGWILLNPRLTKWRGTGLIRFVLTTVLSLLLTLALVFYFAGGRHGGLLVDQLRLLSTHDRRSTVVL